ncbi:MAG TPA: L-histidine N(alpha)-methyltransferase [Burkholderiaceae bacterium]|nr:L-histidine N(alpha)-methyltransferase [Burkholderiaceae bacterium]
MGFADATARMRFIDLLPAGADPAAELRAGLAAPVPWIAPKFFYDALGARLFEAICELPEYTLPRDERVIFDRCTDEIASLIGPGSTLIDLGAGNCAKAERLFEALQPVQYVAVDSAGPFLRAQLEALAGRHRSIDVIGVAADFSPGLVLPPVVRRERRGVFYPGSSIGNFAPEEARAFLSCIHDQCAGGHLLIGADLVKNPAELVAAYDDALGVTASFNLNVLNVVNRLAGTDFTPGDWRHVALFNAAHRRIEMHLEARRELRVGWPGGERNFAAGARIHTENSYKTTSASMSDGLRAAGFGSVRLYTDPAGRFALALAQ